MQTNSIIRISALAFAVAGALAAGQANASGFQLKENSVKAMGRAFAGSASATGDASVVVNNPAAMSTFKKTTVQADVTVVDLSFDFSGGGVAAAGSPLQQPLTGGNGGDAGDTTPIPAISAIFPLGDSGVTVGAMVSAPFGLKTEYEPTWVGRYTAVESEVKTVDFTLSASFDFDAGVSFGLGLVYERAEATLSKAIDFGSSLCRANPAGCNLLYAPQRNDGFIEVEGDDTGIGWIMGMHVHATDNLGIGFSHRSEIDHNISGTADFTVPANTAPILAAGAPGQYVDTAGSAALTTPAVDTLSVTYGINDSWTILGDVSRTQWSSLREVAIVFGNPAQQPNPAVEEFRWEDTIFASLGAEWKLNDQWTFRAGYAEDQTPTRNDLRTPRLPDADRQWLSIGATWAPSENWEISGGYTRINADDPTINLAPSIGTSGSALQGVYSSSVNLWGLSGQYRF
ncbi:outer membrane protein transport protein [Lysobacter sp. A6]|uniref:Outer membrane protein transport protein n=1 Tax=Noviluteimonas lactosilytica TaxID=2888523 RepID=A0ABS8JKQ3_9GAMM|nr:TonB-dependent receptor [Lysobacter lactosilyticus]MCC8364195.1 outer membrane protein transport protein [Lysobacter lactosilyticus]